MRKLCFALSLLASLLVVNPGIDAQSPGLVNVIVQFRSAVNPADVAAVAALGGRVRFRYDIVPAVAASLPPQALQALAANPHVALIEPDAIYSINDVQTELDWTWGVKHIGADAAHASVPAHTGFGVKVAVLDSGINYNHVDLAPNYRGGYDFVNNDIDPWDDHGHGTHVAGTIAAVRDGSGVVGVAPDVQLYALKVMNAEGFGSVSWFIAAIDWAAKNGIQVTNNSYGGTTASAVFEQALANAAAGGMVHVASAGNRGTCDGTGSTVGYPAAYRAVIAVAATDSLDARACFSSTGPDVEIAAPGVQIRSTLRTGLYGDKWNGTSMAAPHVAGTAALLIGAGVPDANGNGRIDDEVRNLIAASVLDLGTPGRDPLHGFGRVDAQRALAAKDAPASLTSSVDSIRYVAGAKSPKDLTIEIGIRYGIVAILPGATVSARVEKNGVTYGHVNGVTNSNGVIAATFKNAPSGTYVTTVTGVSTAGLTWDGVTPANGVVK
jgi:subtilisin